MYMCMYLYTRVACVFSRVLSPFSLARRTEVKSSRIHVSLVVDIVYRESLFACGVYHRRTDYTLDSPTRPTLVSVIDFQNE